MSTDNLTAGVIVKQNFLEIVAVFCHGPRPRLAHAHKVAVAPNHKSHLGFAVVNLDVEICLKGLIYFTDGYGVFPEKKPDYPAAFVFVNERYEVPEVPAWAIRLVLEPEEI